MSKVHRRRRDPPAAPRHSQQERMPGGGGGGPPIAQPGGEPEMGVTRKRQLCLLNLQLIYPRFWKSLHDEVWRSPDPNAALANWAARNHVVDPWFLDMIRDTLAFWTAHPDSPEARLDQACDCWMRFADVLPKPWGMGNYSPRTTPTREPPKEFAARMEVRCHEYNKAYERYYSSEVYYAADFINANPTLLRYIQFSVHRFIGTPLEKLIEMWPEWEKHTEDPDQLITRKVNELASQIGLTLPPWTRKT